MKLSIILFGIVLLICSLCIISYSVRAFKESGKKRHGLFKGLYKVVCFILYPLFFFLVITSVTDILNVGYASIKSLKTPVLNVIVGIISIVISYIFIHKHLAKGIQLFRKQNRDNTKYSDALNKSRMGFVYLLLLAIFACLLQV